jgi:hypothetical protein
MKKHNIGEAMNPEPTFFDEGRYRPWQYTYQVAHEFGHLGTRADKRYPRLDGNKWIEEAICGAYSVYAIRAMSEAEGPLKSGAQNYLPGGGVPSSASKKSPAAAGLRMIRGTVALCQLGAAFL